MAENSALPPLLVDAGLWLGLLITLALFSLLLGDNALARLAQHLLVGAGLGYAALLAIQSVIGPRLLAPLAQGQWLAAGPPLLLGLLLLAAGIERIAAQGRTAPSAAARRSLQTAGVVPLAMLLGVGIAAGLIGVAQGTLIAQTLAAVRLTFAAGRSGGAFWAGLLTLLLTTGTLLALTLDRTRLAGALPGPLTSLLRGWAWLGERALWIAAGVVLARIFASRYTLLVDRLYYLTATLQATGLWQWFAAIWQNLIS